MSDSLFQRRAVATAIDLAIASSPLVIFAPFFFSMLQASEQSAVIAKTIVLSALPLVILIYYFLLFAGALSGKESPGKRTMKLQTISDGAKPLLVRYCLLGALPLLLFYLLGWLPMLLLPILLPLLRSDLRSPLDRIAGIYVCSQK